MPATIRPIIVTADLDRLLAFYTQLLGATEVVRFPTDGLRLERRAQLLGHGARVVRLADRAHHDNPLGPRVHHVGQARRVDPADREPRLVGPALGGFPHQLEAHGRAAGPRARAREKGAAGASPPGAPARVDRTRPRA